MTLITNVKVKYIKAIRQKPDENHKNILLKGYYIICKKLYSHEKEDSGKLKIYTINPRATTEITQGRNI